MNQHNDVLQV